MAGLYADKFSRNQIRISQTVGVPDARGIAGVDQLLLVLPERIPATVWRKVPQGSKLKVLMRRRIKGRVPAVSTRINNNRQTALHVGTTSVSDSAFELLTFARRLIASVNQEKPAVLGIWIVGFSAEDQAVLVKAFVAAALAAAFVMPVFRKESSPPSIRSLKLMGLDERIDLSRIQAEADGNNMTRWLTAMPPNKLDAVEYAAVLSDLAKEHDWQFRKYGVTELKKMNAGAFLAVAQGNADDSACLIRLRYRPSSKKAAPKLTLVGKGIIFDTGGNNLKPFNSMLDMHIDMGGSALAIGTLVAITTLGLDVPVDCWLAITENRIGPTAYKSQDVVTAANGMTIQTIHTDAEGRMALADALVFACNDKPELIIDYATLTGACINAVTTRYCGVFTNDPNLHPVLKKAGRESGERVWPFPLGGEFLDDLKSNTADIKQCSPDGGGDHILAATFLNEFVDKTIPWVHVDLSAALRKGGLAHVPSDITGFGVRFSMQLLLDHGLLSEESVRRPRTASG